MISSLRLKNFQIHRNLTIDFKPGLNFVVGESDRGKSAIVRALRFAALHESASGLTTHGEAAMAVRLTTVGNNVVSRFKNSKEYGYRLNDLPKFLACAREQPVPIATTLNLTPTNFQSQFDPQFLLSLTPGQVAKEINKIVALEDIDRALGWLKERVKVSGIMLEATDAAITGLQEYLTANRQIPRLGDLLTQLRTEAASQAGLRAKSNGITNLVAEIGTLRTRFVGDTATAASCEAAIGQGLVLKALRATKQGLESILRETQAVEALPTLRAAEFALSVRVGAAKRRIALSMLISLAKREDAIILDQKSKILSLIRQKDAKMASQSSQSKQIRDLVDQYEEYHDEVDQYRHTEHKLEQTLALRAVCSKCGRAL